MIKDLLAKSIKNRYEIHCVKIDDLHANQSVVGSISGGGKRKTSGSTYTLHQSVVNANNRLYQDVQKNGSYPFKVGDQMAFTCMEQKNGIWSIDSLINFTNKSKVLINRFFSYLFFCPLYLFIALFPTIFLMWITLELGSALEKHGNFVFAWLTFGLTMLVILAYFAFFFWLPYYLYHDYKNNKYALQVLEALKNMNNEEEIKSCLASYKGKSLISENFFSAAATESKIE